MAHHQSTQRGCCRPRRAVATLEFVMALPLLFALMLCILWLGFWMIGKSELLIEARNKAWKERFKNASKEPLVFPVPGQSLLYDKKKDYVTQEMTKRIDISPIFDAFAGPVAAHTILAGSWDHQAMGFERPPEIKLMAKAAAIGWGGEVFDWLSQIDNPVGLFKTLGANVKKQADAAPTTVTQGDETSDSGSGSGGVPGSVPPSDTAKDGEELTEARREARIKELKDLYIKLGGKVDPLKPWDDTLLPLRGDLKLVNEETARLQEERAAKFREAEVEQDSEKKKQLQKELAQLQRKIDLTRIKYKRLETEARDVIAELDALGVDRWDLASI
jgi:hypothetical protein